MIGAADARSPRPSARTPVLRCAIYTRKSSEEGLEQGFNSLHAQREACEAYVLSQQGEGWRTLAAAYDDGGFSGGTMERPGLKQLLADIDRGLIDVVVVYKVDRLTRALSDFAKIVERFDARRVSFVSVTQAFNTTSSMGRLTLNVLLSFAQFEREVTGERIRDKIAASKAKGMWMGGHPPLGYDVKDRALVVNEAEARQVRHVFTRYRALASVHVLRDELASEGCRSKSWVSQKGISHGGVPMARGALFHLLKNRLYRGKIVHRDAVHLGRHAPIVPADLFDAVQARLADARRGPRQRANGMPLGVVRSAAWVAPLTGLLRDDRGNTMTPSFAVKGGNRRYRYYTSAALQKGRPVEAGSLPRVPAEPIEQLVLDRVTRFLGISSQTGKSLADPSAPADRNVWTTVRDALLRVEVGADKVVLLFRRDAVDGNAGRGSAPEDTLRARLPADDALSHDRDTVTLTIAVTLKQRRGSGMMIGPGGTPAIDAPQIDFVLVKALGRAQGWRDAIVCGAELTLIAIARKERVGVSYARRLLRLAFLAPDLKRSILHGRTPIGLTLEQVMRADLPLAWSDQRKLFHGVYS